MKSLNSFKSASTVFAMGFTVLLGAAPFATAGIITPLDTGNATFSSTGEVSNFAAIPGAFDDQPTSAPTVGPAPAERGARFTIFNSPAAPAISRAGYLDFGADYADITLEKVNVLLRQFGPVVNPIQTYTWSDDTVIDASDAAAPNFGLFSDVSGGNGTIEWTEVWSGSAEVQERYLIYQFGSTPGDRGSEIALVGTVDVPEPASLLLVGLGSLLIVGRRSQA